MIMSQSQVTYNQVKNNPHQKKVFLWPLVHTIFSALEKKILYKVLSTKIICQQNLNAFFFSVPSVIFKGSNLRLAEDQWLSLHANIVIRQLSDIKPGKYKPCH